MIEMHKRKMEFWKSKLGISDYGVAWIAFLKGLVLGLLIYHFGIAAEEAVGRIQQGRLFLYN